MAKHHSSVNYVEPNVSAESAWSDSGGTYDWAVDDGYNRAPRIEDYCIMVNLEVEVCSRNNISANKRITKDVLVLSYKSNNKTGESTVNFMGGTKVMCGDAENRSMNYLTTNYADMYVGDLIDYGTTEMIGIKSIDIEYEKACIPRITIKFTDVRGLSLFQPTELSRTNSYQGILGINADNVAQSFFQCFFKLPMPRFTITIKGFYGKPVTYEVMCDKFDTQFNSATGDFDVTTKFIGYSYSFLTDISIDSLISAPYSDYLGRSSNGLNNYWVKERDETQRFFVLGRDGQKVKMPTLVEVWENYHTIVKQQQTTDDTSLTDEERTHSDEISKLDTIEKNCIMWYETLFNLCCERYGKDYCYLFRESIGDNEAYTKILILATENASNDLSAAYEQFPEDFKTLNESLYSEIDAFNSNENNVTLDNVSKDFKAYTLHKVFRPIRIKPKKNISFSDGGVIESEFVFGGFDEDNYLNESEVIDNIFKGVKIEENDVQTSEDIARKKEEHKINVLETIYNDGANQFLNAYVIDLNYIDTTKRIKLLQHDASRSETEKSDEKKLAEFNKKMLDSMNWYPSVENFTRIMIAHLETLMHMMYELSSNCKGRTASQLGVTVGENGNCPDVSSNLNEVPPFPRVTREILGNDGITKFEDTWVGEYTNGIGFQEVDFINGLLNGIGRIRAIMKDIAQRDGGGGDGDNPTEDVKPIIKHPLSSFDLFISKSPYGDVDEINNDVNGYDFIGKVAIRMFNILGLNHFVSKNAPEKISSLFTKNIERLAEIEADNFHEHVLLSLDVRNALRNGTTFTWDNIKNVITKENKDEKCPWGSVPLLDNTDGNYWLRRWKVTTIGNDGKEKWLNYIYPIQNVSFTTLQNEIKPYVDQGGMTANEDVSFAELRKPKSGKVLPKSNNGFGNLVIFDNYLRVDEQLDTAISNSDSEYSDFYNSLKEACGFSDVMYQKCYYTRNPKYMSICTKSGIQGSYFKIEDGKVVIYASDNNGAYDSFLSDNWSNGAPNPTNLTVKEIFGIKEEGGKIDVNYDGSFKMTDSTKRSQKIVNETFNDEVDGHISYLARMVGCIRMGFGDLFTQYSVGYAPRLAVLKIGAIILASKDIFKKWNSVSDFKKTCRSNWYPIDGCSNDNIENIMGLQPSVKYAYARYFIDWAQAHRHWVRESRDDKNYVFTQSMGEKDIEMEDTRFISVGGNVREIKTKRKKTVNSPIYRRIIKEGTDFSDSFNFNLMQPVAIVKLSVNVSKSSASSYSLNESTMKTFFDKFIERVKKNNMIDYQADNSGNVVKMADEPHKSTTDMKKELYRYMKQVYDKWIPMSDFEDWQLESFFNTENGESKGHKFYFIDSYYNSLGDKLLINPKILYEKINALFSYSDINAMMLGFMSDIYAYNRCMFMCIQNFSDLTKKNSMNEMFTPLPYNSIMSTNKYPSFVIVYPYEPSKNLDIHNNEYNDDSFMLNDETKTPKAIRSKDVDGKKGHYMIPAFGVTYGKQYQSYFKSVDVNMNNPIATEQAIKVKHMILQEQAAGEVTTTAQDLYDLYSTQSYTCNVTMMGCAWIQPLMYFVLLNVPMFRGSYLIMKVRHSIKPGDMTTTFTGCRMANVSTSLVQNIFVDNQFANGDDSSDITRRKNEAASIDNDCPYKIYSLWEDDDVEISKDEMENAKNAMGILMSTYGFSKAAAAGICGNIFVESTWRLHITNGIGAFGLCQWLGDRKKLLISKYGNSPTFSQQMDYINYEWNNEKTAKSGKKKLDAETNPQNAASIVMNYFERPSDNEKNKTIGTRKSRAQKYFNNYDSNTSINTSQPSSKDANDKKDVMDAFFDAVNRSAQYTPSIGVSLEKKIVANAYQTSSGKKATEKWLQITQSGGNNKLGMVFDLILNSEYYNYVQKLCWTYPDGGLESDVNPTSIYCMVSENVEPNKKMVYMVKQGGKIYNSDLNAWEPRDLPSGNTTLLKSLAKRFTMTSREIPQLTDISILEKYKPQDCDSLFNSGGGVNYGVNATPSDVSHAVTGQIDGWDVGKVVRYINNVASPCQPNSKCGDGRCATVVEEAIKEGGGPLSNKIATSEVHKASIYATNLHYDGILSKHGFVQIYSGKVQSRGNFDKSKLQAGDVCIVGKNARVEGGRYHACIWVGNEWVSDFKQPNMNVYREEYPFFIYRFRNKKLS